MGKGYRKKAERHVLISDVAASIGNLPPFVTHLLRMSEESVVNEMTILSDLVHMYQCKIGIELCH